MRPPIASPFGDGDERSSQESCDFRLGIRIDYRLNAWCAPRKNVKELILVPASVGFVLLAVTLLAAILYPALRFPPMSFFELWVVCWCGLPVFSIVLSAPFSLWETRNRKSVILTSYGVVHLQGKKQVEMVWHAFLPIVFWSGDVLLITLTTSIFLPREVFASPQEAREFIGIARELRRTRGAVWRNEWNGKTFGFQT